MKQDAFNISANSPTPLKTCADCAREYFPAGVVLVKLHGNPKEVQSATPKVL
jgi:hypothetical protein